MKGYREKHCLSEILFKYLESRDAFIPCKGFLQETTCYFALFCFPLRWDSDAMLGSRFHPAWHFGKSLLEKPQVFETGS